MIDRHYLKEKRSKVIYGRHINLSVTWQGRFITCDFSALLRKRANWIFLVGNNTTVRWHIPPLRNLASGYLWRLNRVTLSLSLSLSKRGSSWYSFSIALRVQISLNLGEKHSRETERGRERESIEWRHLKDNHCVVSVDRVRSIQWESVRRVIIISMKPHSRA